MTRPDEMLPAVRASALAGVSAGVLSPDEILGAFVAARVSAARSRDAHVSLTYPSVTAGMAALFAALAGTLIGGRDWFGSVFATAVIVATFVGGFVPGWLWANACHERHARIVAGLDAFAATIVRPFQADNGVTPSPAAVIRAAMTLRQFPQCRLLCEQLVGKFVLPDASSFQALCLEAVDLDSQGRGVISDAELTEGLLRLTTPRGRALFQAVADGWQLDVPDRKFAPYTQAIGLADVLDTHPGAWQVFETLVNDAQASRTLSWDELEQFVDVSTAAVTTST